MLMKFKLEICVDTLESAIVAQNAGADRVELCNNLPEGGTTPGYGSIISARNNLTIGLHVIIRPRGGDFLYSDIDYDIMRKEIDICGECGVDGVVLGILLPGGEIDIERTSKLAELARPMSVTFHRAYDMCRDPIEALEDVIAAGADRLLTSGLMNKAEEGIELINRLVRQAGNRLIIMPGSGINAENIIKIARGTAADEFHLTGRKVKDSEMVFRRPGISMGSSPDTSEFLSKAADREVIRAIINNLNLI
jgi:copper homeostasis protein